MASWREINEFTKDAKACRDLARRLFDVYGDAINEWEMTFLESISRKDRAQQFTTRQCEKLLQIRDDMQPVIELHGFKLDILLARCFEARNDLSEDDEEWILALKEKTNNRHMRQRDARRLLRCSRELNLIESMFA